MGPTQYPKAAIGASSGNPLKHDTQQVSCQLHRITCKIEFVARFDGAYLGPAGDYFGLHKI